MKILLRACEKHNRRGHRSTTRCGTILSPNLHVRIHLTTPWQQALVDQHPLEILLPRASKMSLKFTDHLAAGLQGVEIWEAMGTGTCILLD